MATNQKFEEKKGFFEIQFYLLYIHTTIELKTLPKILSNRKVLPGVPHQIEEGGSDGLYELNGSLGKLLFGCKIHNPCFTYQLNIYSIENI